MAAEPNIKVSILKNPMTNQTVKEDVGTISIEFMVLSFMRFRLILSKPIVAGAAWKSNRHSSAPY